MIGSVSIIYNNESQIGKITREYLGELTTENILFTSARVLVNAMKQKEYN